MFTTKAIYDLEVIQKKASEITRYTITYNEDKLYNTKYRLLEILKKVNKLFYVLIDVDFLKNNEAYKSDILGSIREIQSKLMNALANNNYEVDFASLVYSTMSMIEKLALENKLKITSP